MLIEGVPRQYRRMAKNRPESICVGVAICDPSNMPQMSSEFLGILPECPLGSMHYLFDPDHPHPGVSGFAELMSAEYLEKWHLRPGRDIQKSSTCAKCVGLSDVLADFDYDHVDYFSLDVEGGELDVLETIDFEKFSFGVLTYEVHIGKAEMGDGIAGLLSKLGYVESRLFDDDRGMNRFFFSRRVNDTFVPPSRRVLSSYGFTTYTGPVSES